MDDETLYQRMRSGDHQALYELLQRYHKPLYQFLCRFTGEEQLAEDIVQDVFVRLMTHQNHSPMQLKAWLYAVARNLARDHFRSARYRYEQAADFDTDDHLLPVLDSERQIDVEEALQRLTIDQREVILLRFYHDLKVDEIAKIIGVPSGTIKSRLFHALKRLKGLFVQMEILNHDEN